MEREVIVSVIGTQFRMDETDSPVEIITTGEYFYKNDKHYVLYEEIIEGTSSVTKSTLKFTDDEVVLKRSGALNVTMVFNKKNKTTSSYMTPFGNLLIGIDTKNIKYRNQDDKMTLVVEYALDVNYEYLTDCELSVKISPKNNGVSLT